MFLRSFCATLLFLGVATAAAAMDARFAGSWRIDSAAPAPWAGPGDIDPKEAKALVGKTVSFGPKSIAGPQPIGCKGPHYGVRESDGPDMLFEGMLAEPDKAGKPRNAAALAREIGMTTPTVATLEVGCTEIAFHAIAPDRLVFALDNQIYTLKRAGN
ncbi:hypothetical protein [Methylocystis parvus]|uniref:hypothetical protein n=1 Tax=Methylocystis parvus TaxID=134 RepID=UPI003C75795A